MGADRFGCSESNDDLPNAYVSKIYGKQVGNAGIDCNDHGRICGRHRERVESEKKSDPLNATHKTTARMTSIGSHPVFRPTAVRPGWGWGQVGVRPGWGWGQGESPSHNPLPPQFHNPPTPSLSTNVSECSRQLSGDSPVGHCLHYYSQAFGVEFDNIDWRNGTKPARFIAGRGGRMLHKE